MRHRMVILTSFAVVGLGLVCAATPSIAETPKKLESLVEPNAQANAASTGADMKKLSDEVGTVFQKNGYAAAGCVPQCTATVTIGPDGKPKPGVSCTLVCN